jgi:3-oxoacyl-[acyl-carrier-protein] synthase III
MTAAFGIAGIGVLTGWGDGIAALPDDARRAAHGRPVVPIPTPPLTGERFRRATRECLLGVAAVEAALSVAGLGRDEMAGAETALVYATAGGYGASNRAFLDAAAGGALHFPYTAPSAVPAEVAIEFGLTGSYVILIGGATATLEALWHASALIERGAARRALVLTVETFTENADLYAKGRRLLGTPLVEAAACAVVVPGMARITWHTAGATSDEASGWEARARARAGETLACAPLIALALASDERDGVTVTGRWRGRRAGLEWNPRETGRT